jgi:hypothetical protein
MAFLVVLGELFDEIALVDAKAVECVQGSAPFECRPRLTEDTSPAAGRMQEINRGSRKT